MLQRTFRIHFCCLASPWFSSLVIPTRRLFQFFEFYVQAFAREVELTPRDLRHKIDDHAILIFHRGARTRAALRGVRFDPLVVAAKVFRGF
jgi:hypothetical protein